VDLPEDIGNEWEVVSGSITENGAIRRAVARKSAKDSAGMGIGEAK
jgi:hypothetical protein